MPVRWVRVTHTMLDGSQRALTVALALMLWAIPATSIASRARTEADSLRSLARERLKLGTLDARRQAMTELERASQLAPDDHHVWLDLGRLCLERGERQRGRDCYDRARRAAPDDPRAWAELGAAWTWEWLSSFDDSALANAARDLQRAAELNPDDAATWARLSALLIARGRPRAAEHAAGLGLAASPHAWEPILALGCAAWRQSRPALADSAFALARTRAPDEVRQRFTAAPWTVDDRESPNWDHLPDPDLTTPENEAELDYLTRLGLALLLFRDARGLRWDMRTELYVRYGPPAAVEINPVDRTEFWWVRGFYSPNHRYLPPPMFFPYTCQVWAYPDLGMAVELWDRTLSQTFVLPIATDDYADPRPNPALLANRPDLLALADGRGVFRTMAPGSRPVNAQGQVARFPTADGMLLLAHVVTAGVPTDTLRGAWAVVAADGRVVTRGSHLMSPSACDPSTQRVAEFSATVPPGEYYVDLSVSGTGGRRGLVRLDAAVAPPTDSLDLSDLVLVCGASTPVSSDPVRIEPNLERRVSGNEPMAIYLEIGHLQPGHDGRSRFLYSTSIHPAGRDARRAGHPVYEASREEDFDGTRRRQFITVPTRSIRRGVYELRIQVRDLVSGTQAASALRFERD